MWLFSRLRKPTSNRAPRFRPRLEALEDRWLPSTVSLTVNSLADDSGPGTLRAAILAADAGSQSDKFTIDFTVSGAIDLQNPLPELNNSIAINGPGAASLTVERDAAISFSSAVVTVDAGQSASLSGLTIANGNAHGVLNAGTLTISNSTISGSFGINGGGILNVGTLAVSNSIFSGNSAVNGGGILNGAAGPLTVRGSTFSGNTAANRGGGLMNEGTATVQDSTLSGNTSENGGGLYNLGTATVQNSILSGNTATDGGGIFNNPFGTLTVRSSTFSGNTASGTGASRVVGGGLYNAGTATVQGSALSDNSAVTAGGGIFNAASGTLSVDDSTVLKNVAPLGADLDNLGALTLNDSTVGVIGP